jgi:hypothetical protein
MLADPDLLLIAVFCTADDLLPQPAKSAKRILDRRRGLHSLRGAGDDGDRLGCALPQGGAQAGGSPVPGLAETVRLSEAPAAAE